MKPILAITMGDINGIGPEILAKALSEPEMWDVCSPIVIGCAEAYEAARIEVGCGPEALRILQISDAQMAGGKVAILEEEHSVPERRPGKLDAEAGRCAMEWLERAVSLAVSGEVHGIVTCPIQKEGIRLAGYTVSGHTDYIAQLTDTSDYWMTLFADSMRIVHVSGHLSLRNALECVRKERIADAIRVGHDALVRIGTPTRRIGVAGLNPHAGEGGAFGSEDREEILPAVEECRGEGIDCFGPLPADTIFRRMYEGEFDLVVAMYHDQGHIPLKLIAMDTGVNVTLGIPIVRTSVDHGTAYDIAGTGTARGQSLCAAIKFAAQLANTV